MRRRHGRATDLLVASALMLALLALAAPAGAAGGAGTHLALSSASASVGERVSISGSGFRPRMKVLLIFGRRQIASSRAGRRGRFVIRFTVPAVASGQVRLLAEQLARAASGRIRRLRWAKVSLHVLPGGPAGALTPSAKSAPKGSSPGGPGAGAAGRWIPPQHLTWYWQLQGAVNNNEPVAAYDIDGFENSASEVAALHAQGKHVICYIDVGTAETRAATMERSRHRCSGST